MTKENAYPFGGQGIYNIVKREQPMIQTKPVTCKHCGAVNQHNSFQCATIRKPIAKKSDKKLEEERLNVKPAPRPAINKVADKRKKELQVYAKISKEFKLDNPYCHARLDGCTTMTTDVHHPDGRSGTKLNDVMSFIPVCRSCHNWIHDHDKEARDLGLLRSRLETTKNPSLS